MLARLPPLWGRIEDAVTVLHLGGIICYVLPFLDISAE